MKISLLPKFLVLPLFLVFMLPARGQEKVKPYYAKIQSTSNKEFKGVLKQADEKGIYLEKKAGKSEEFIPVNEIRVIKLRKKAAAGTGTAIGMAVGLAGGLGVAAATHQDGDKLTNTLGGLGAALITFAGGVVGGSIGGAYKQVILINGRAENYLQALEKLQTLSVAAE